VAGRRDDDVIKLSLGNQQRVQLAAALAHDPEILVLDEPFSGLDPVAVDVMSGVLRDQADAGVPGMFSSHQLDLVQRLCDRVGIVRQGRMVAVGTVDELRDQGQDELIVRAPAAPPGWAAKLPGVTVVEESGGDTRLALHDGADDQAILRAALETGPVHEFTRARPSLTDLFRHIVSADEERIVSIEDQS
jgi:ABC-2 type transport system ATP-binding protein